MNPQLDQRRQYSGHTNDAVALCAARPEMDDCSGVRLSLRGRATPLPFQLLDMRDWQTQQVVMLTILTSLAVLIGRVGRCTGYSSSFHCDSIVGALYLLTLFNTVPIVIADHHAFGPLPGWMSAERMWLFECYSRLHRHRNCPTRAT